MPNTAKDEAFRRITHDLYRSMPGAPGVPDDGSRILWGEVEDNAHYEFCAVIAKHLVDLSGLTFIDRD